MPRATVNGIELHYETLGNGEPLLLIAGFGCDHTIWSLVAPVLAEQFRVIAFDNRGVGQSTANETEISIAQMADDAAGLLEALGIDSAHIAGHSMGGLIAQELALAHPKKVRSLLLLSTCAQLDARGKAIIESLGDLPGQVDVETATRLILPWMYTGAFYALPGAVEQIIELVLASPYPPSPAVLHKQSRAIIAARTANRLDKLNCPSFVVVGREDILLPVAYSEQLSKGIRGAELTILENTGHGMIIESAEAVANTMLEFLDRQREANA